MATALPEAASTAQMQYLTFHLGDEEYGVGILQAKEIIEYDKVTKVPRAPGFIRGVINLRGTVVPVVDLALKFGQTPKPVTRKTCIVLVEVEADDATSTIGVVADGVSQVVELAPTDIEEPPSFGTPVKAHHLLGLGKAGKRFILLLDIQRLLSLPEMTAAQQVVDSVTDER